jgi:hypothetical protein
MVSWLERVAVVSCHQSKLLAGRGLPISISIQTIAWRAFHGLSSFLKEPRFPAVPRHAGCVHVVCLLPPLVQRLGTPDVIQCFPPPNFPSCTVRAGLVLVRALPSGSPPGSFAPLSNHRSPPASITDPNPTTGSALAPPGSRGIGPIPTGVDGSPRQLAACLARRRGGSAKDNPLRPPGSHGQLCPQSALVLHSRRSKTPPLAGNRWPRDLGPP